MVLKTSLYLFLSSFLVILSAQDTGLPLTIKIKDQSHLFNKVIITRNEQIMQTPNMPEVCCPIKTIWADPVGTAIRLSLCSADDKKSERQAAIFFIGAAILLRIFLYAFDMAYMFSQAAAGNFSWLLVISYWPVKLLMVPFLLFWAFFRLYPVVLHRFLLMFCGQISEMQTRLVFAWGALWIVASGFVFWAFSLIMDLLAGQDETVWMLWSTLGPLVIIGAGVLIFVTMMASAAKMRFWPAFFAISLASVFPILLIQLGFVWIEQLMLFFVQQAGAAA